MKKAIVPKKIRLKNPLHSMENSYLTFNTICIIKLKRYFYTLILKPMKQNFNQPIILIFLCCFLGFSQISRAQSDTVKVQLTNELPAINGIGIDACWTAPGVEWQMIDQVWMPWKGTIPTSDDFTGKYKVVWNETSNLLYFLVEVVDDKFVDGYNFATNGPYGYPNYDVVEIFIDEDRSKGPHVFDNGTENAQNALSYHISVNAPADGETTNEFTVEDLDGVNWSNNWVVNYAAHFPEFAMKKMGNTYVYEFSLKVYNDTYPTQQKNGNTATDVEKSRVVLTKGKIMGMSVAYCDNDANDGKRDNFFGSTPGKEYTANFGFMGTGNSITSENGQDIFNTCWMSANDYGVLKLADSGSTSTSAKTLPFNENISIVPTNIESSFCLSVSSGATGNLKVEIFGMNGMKVAEFSDKKMATEYEKDFDINCINKGIYIVKVTFGNNVFVQKIIKPY